MMQPIRWLLDLPEFVKVIGAVLTIGSASAAGALTFSGFVSHPAIMRRVERVETRVDSLMIEQRDTHKMVGQLICLSQAERQHTHWQDCFRTVAR